MQSRSIVGILAVCAGTALLGSAAPARAQVTYINDTFSTFAPGNLVGQNGWTQLGAAAGLPLQVTGGQVVIPFGQDADNQDAYKNFTGSSLSMTGTTSYFFGWNAAITNAPTITPSYFAALSTDINGGGFANYRVAASDAGGGNFNYGMRITGQGTDPFTFGGDLPYNTAHTVIAELLPNASGGTQFNMYVNPTSGDLGSQTPYLSHTIGAGAAPPLTVGSLIISQFASGTVGNSGVLFDQVVATDNFTLAYNALVVPEPTSLAFTGVGVLAAAWIRRRRQARIAAA